MKISRIILLFCVIGIILLAAACSQAQSPQESGLQVYNWSMSIGGVGNSMDKTKLTYSIDLTNKNQREIYVSSVALVTGEKVIDRIIGGQTDIPLNMVLKANETVQLKGELIIDTKGMDKAYIQGLEPFITGVKATSEETIDLKSK